MWKKHAKGKAASGHGTRIPLLLPFLALYLSAAPLSDPPAEQTQETPGKAGTAGVPQKSPAKNRSAQVVTPAKACLSQNKILFYLQLFFNSSTFFINNFQIRQGVQRAEIRFFPLI